MPESRRIPVMGKTLVRLVLTTFVALECLTSDALALYDQELDKASHDSCKSVRYHDLPEIVKDVLKKMKCEVGPQSTYDYGYAMDLNGDGLLEYQYCCGEPRHGPCSSLVIGKIRSQWKNLIGKTSYQFDLYRDAGTPCYGISILESQHGGFHDIRILRSSDWWFLNGKYRLWLDGKLLVTENGMNPQLGTFPRSFEEEVGQCLENIRLALKDADMTFDHLLSLRVLLANKQLIDRMHAVLKTYFKGQNTRTEVVLSRRPLNDTARIEIMVTVTRDKQ